MAPLPKIEVKNEPGKPFQKLKPANDNSPAAKGKASAPFPGVVSSGEFVRDFVPPDYHIDGIAHAGAVQGRCLCIGEGSIRGAVGHEKEGAWWCKGWGRTEGRA